MKVSIDRMKKIKADQHMSVFQDENGHELKVAHQRLSSKLRKQLDDIPVHEEPKEDVPVRHYAEGTPDAPVQPNDSSAAPQPATPDININVGAPQQAQPQVQAPAPAQNVAPSAPQNPSVQTVAPNPLYAGNQAYNQAYMQGLNQQTGGIQGEAGVAGQMGQANVAVEKQRQQELAKIADKHQQLVSHYENESNAILNDMKNNHINPNQYLESKDTLGKIQTALGMVIMGAGGNDAMGWLNHQIDRNIDAQKANMNNKSNLLNALNNQFGNMRDAEQMYRSIMLDGYASKMSEMANKYAGPMQQQIAAQKIGLLNQQSAAIRSDIAFKNSAYSADNPQPSGNQLASNAPGGGGQTQGQQLSRLDPALLVGRIVPKEHQTKALEEISIREAAIKSREKLMEHFNEAAKENTVLATGAGMLRTPASVLNMQALFPPLIHQTEGKVAEFEQNTLNNLIPKPGDTAAKIAAKRKGMLDFLDQRMEAPTNRMAGIDLDRYERTSSKGGIKKMSAKEQSYLDWAKKNPKDARARAVLKKLGAE